MLTCSVCSVTLAILAARNEARSTKREKTDPRTSRALNPEEIFDKSDPRAANLCIMEDPQCSQKGPFIGFIAAISVYSARYRIKA